MTTEKAPTKAEFLEALKKNGINNLEDLLNAIMPETGGFIQDYVSEENSELRFPLATIPGRGRLNLIYSWALDENNPF